MAAPAATVPTPMPHTGAYEDGRRPSTSEHSHTQMATRDHVTIVIIIKPTYRPCLKGLLARQHKIILVWPSRKVDIYKRVL